MVLFRRKGVLPDVRKTVNRKDFIARLMQDTGLTYDEAIQVFECLISVIEDAVVNVETVRFGRVGALVPHVRPPREVQMGFRVGKGRQVTKVRRIYNLDSRIGFRFRLYRRFMETHQLNWFPT